MMSPSIMPPRFPQSTLRAPYDLRQRPLDFATGLSLRRRKISFILLQFSIVPETLFLDGLYASMFLSCIWRYSWLDRIVMTDFANIAWHVIQHTPAAMLRNVKILAERRPGNIV